jgi:hypothetical protein
MRKILIPISVMLATCVPAFAINFPIIPSNEIPAIDIYNSRLIQEQQLLLFLIALLFFSLVINLGLIYLYIQYINSNREFDSRIVSVRFALTDLGNKAEALLGSGEAQDGTSATLPFNLSGDEELEFLDFHHNH